jgi:hypothetical protein
VPEVLFLIAVAVWVLVAVFVVCLCVEVRWADEAWNEARRNWQP